MVRYYCKKKCRYIDLEIVKDEKCFTIDNTTISVCINFIVEADETIFKNEDLKVN